MTRRVGPMAAAFVLLAIAFSGCSGGSAGGPESAPQGTSVVEVTGEAVADAGTIIGTVTDDSISPLAGAQVGILDQPLTATTDEGGRFEFRNLAPGTYKLAAQKLGYDSMSKAIDLPPSGEAKVSFILTPIALDDAKFIDLFFFNLFMACGTGFVVVTVTYGSALCPEAVFGPAKATQDHNVTKRIQTAIGEMEWRQTTTFAAKHMRLDFGKDESGGSTPAFKYPYGRKTGPSPVQIRADEPFDGLSKLADDKGAKIRYRIWVPFSSPDPPIVMLVFQQKLDVYSSFFYGEPAPENYSGLPDG